MSEILNVTNLKTYYHSRNKIVPAVDGVSFTLAKGETLGIVGESGCGKSTAARSIIDLLDRSYTKIEDGQVMYQGKDLLTLSRQEMNRIRGKEISMIFQNPLTSLNPVFAVGKQITEVLLLHEKMDKQQARKRAIELLGLVGIPSPELRMDDYPHQLSGGMQQRIIIAIALACNPEIIIADEPTTALDVTIQAQILDLITQLKEKMNMGMILISHNMGIVAQLCNRILVMYGGVVVEEGLTVDVFTQPLHPYTRGLLEAIPSTAKDTEELYAIPGNVPRFTHPVTGCRFFSRCDKACDKCATTEPPLFESEEKHWVRCWLYQKEGGQQNER